MPEDTLLARVALRCTPWAERWFPRTWWFPALSVIVVALATLSIGATPLDTVVGFGKGIQRTLVFALWLVVAIITSHLLATTPPATRIIDRIATLPRTSRGAVCCVALVGMLLALLSWSFSLVFTPMLVRALARRRQLGMDYRAAGAAAYLGVGTTWALGLSSFAPLVQGIPPSGTRPDIFKVTAGQPLGERLFFWQSAAMVVVLVIVSLAVCWWTTPTSRAKTIGDLGLPNPALRIGARRTRGVNFSWIDRGPFMAVLVCALGLFFVGHELATKPASAVFGNLNTYYVLFFLLAQALHPTADAIRDAVSRAYPSVGGVLLAFPIYGGVAALLTQVHGSDGGTLLAHLCQAFAHVASSEAFSLMVGAFAVGFGFFIPGGDSTWLTEVPAVTHAADMLHMPSGWITQAHGAAVVLPNLINPFWMLPLLGVLGLKARDIVGFTAIQFVVHVPLVFGMLWLLGQTLL